MNIAGYLLLAIAALAGIVLTVADRTAQFYRASERPASRDFGFGRWSAWKYRPEARHALVQARAAGIVMMLAGLAAAAIFAASG